MLFIIHIKKIKINKIYKNIGKIYYGNYNIIKFQYMKLINYLKIFHFMI